MKSVTLYPHNGGPGITPHPSKAEEMKAKGWKEPEPKPVIRPKIVTRPKKEVK